MHTYRIPVLELYVQYVSTRVGINLPASIDLPQSVLLVFRITNVTGLEIRECSYRD